MLDSGAYTAWAKGNQISLNNYIAYVRKHQRILFAYVNLDEIPGSMKMMTRDSNSVEKSARKSYENLQRMKDAGLRPIPVFHQGEKFSWLERLLDDGEDYIGLSPFRVSRRGDILRWLDNCFSLLVNKQGKPIVKTHGFGTTAPLYIFRYPWYSLDSTSWAMVAGNGSVMVPQLKSSGRGFDLMKPPVTLTVTKRKKDGCKLIFSSEAVRKTVEAFIKPLKLSIQDLEHTHIARSITTLTYYKLLQEQLIMPRFGRTDINSFFSNHTTHSNLDGLEHKIKIFFSTSLHSRPQGRTLNKLDMRNRLVSYFYILRDRNTDEQLEQYVNTGLVDYSQRTKQRGDK